METPKMPGDLYTEVYGKFVPRLCVDTIIIGPEDEIHLTNQDFTNAIFEVTGPRGIILAERDIPPQIYSWHLPGGTVKKGETLEAASKRIVKRETGLDINILGQAGFMEFLSEEQEVDVDGKPVKINVHSASIVLIARAIEDMENFSQSKKVGWFKNPPPVEHTVHIPFLLKHGFLKNK